MLMTTSIDFRIIDDKKKNIEGILTKNSLKWTISKKNFFQMYIKLVILFLLKMKIKFGKLNSIQK